MEPSAWGTLLAAWRQGRVRDFTDMAAVLHLAAALCRDAFVALLAFVPLMPTDMASL